MPPICIPLIMENGISGFNMSLQDTPNAVRLHIGIFGKRNSGKSTLLNAITKQKVSTVSPVAGTTTDPVVKAMELHGLGPVVFYDTAGFDDEGELGNLRVEKTVEVTQKTDMAILVFRDMDISWEMTWYKKLKEKQIPVLCIWNQDAEDEKVYADVVTQIEKKTGSDVLITNVKELVTDDVCQALIRLLPSDFTEETITGHLVQENDSACYAAGYTGSKGKIDPAAGTDNSRSAGSQMYYSKLYKRYVRCGSFSFVKAAEADNHRLTGVSACI